MMSKKWYIIISFLIISLFMSTASSAISPLEKAYKQEIQLLRSEQHELQVRLRKLKQQSEQELDDLKNNVGSLSEQVTALRLENESLEDRLRQEEEIVHVSGDRTALLDNTLDQMTSTLLRYNIVFNEEEVLEPHILVEKAFQQGSQLVSNKGAIRVIREDYFNIDGEKHNAEVLWLSQVAAVSLNEQDGGILGPAGEDALKVLYPQEMEQAKQYVLGEEPLLVGVYLFDPLEKQVAMAQNGRSLLETIEAGGFVMWPILMLALLALFILVERLLILRRVHTNADRLMGIVGDYISRGKWQKASDACHKTPGAVARVLGTILRHRQQHRSQLEELVNESILAERPTMERFLPALNVVAAVAPLLGLLGTVTGMIGTFHVITEHGTGDPRLLSGGISEALLTTQFGLMVAIPALLIHTLLTSWVDHVLADMETNALRLLNKMHCEHCQRLKSGDCQGSNNGPDDCPNLQNTQAFVADSDGVEEQTQGKTGLAHV